MPRRTVLVAALATLAPATAATATAQADAPAFGCSATALSGTVLGQVVSPGFTAGDDSACRSDDASGPVLGTRGIASTLLGGAGSATTATSTAGLDSLSINGLDALKGLLPAVALPAGLDAIPVTLPAGVSLPGGITLPTLPTAPLPTVPGLPALPGGGLPLTRSADTSSAVTVPSLPTVVPIDVTPAVNALLAAAQQLPAADLLHLDAVRATAAAVCQAGAPVLSGITQLAGASALGQALPVDGPVTRSIPVLNGSSISLADLDLSKVVLPAGLSFDTPVVGPLLATGLKAALAALPPIQIPTTLADVSITPGSQDRAGASLVQHAPRIRVSVLGQQLVDLDLGAARVSALGVDCGAAAAPSPVAPASQLAVQCAKRGVTLVDVAPTAGHVALLGAAAASDVGKKVQIVFPATHKVVATTVVRPDGFFRAKAPLPSAAMRHSNDARYLAVVDGKKSLSLKLDRRMRISSIRHKGRMLRVIGKIAGPLAPGQEIVIRRSESCSKDVVVKRFVPTKAGTWKVLLPAPSEGQAAVFRATTEVLGADGTSDKTFPTFTLPGYVSL
ncbi:hypothetical protein NBH00_02005 [Paraconexibacter antarcticus]|uniref:Uncharacterized protein n=1 Tax=Paraconexibacter antarcticus TaxID=2949664 RepID=A0ABY5DWD2_9ACTN|nr:hypothetical protein [Paraconexibacter antarcticus]UTI64992.1 hypothetical protein NBH00_02005 [Paraconexibacter antarcticus]